MQHFVIKLFLQWLELGVPKRCIISQEIVPSVFCYATIEALVYKVIFFTLPRAANLLPQSAHIYRAIYLTVRRKQDAFLNILCFLEMEKLSTSS